MVVFQIIGMCTCIIVFFGICTYIYSVASDFYVKVINYRNARDLEETLGQRIKKLESDLFGMESQYLRSVKHVQLLKSIIDVYKQEKKKSKE